MRRILAALLAAALLCPSPVLAAELELSLKGSEPVAVSPVSAQIGSQEALAPLPALPLVAAPSIVPFASASPSVTQAAMTAPVTARASAEKLAQAVAKPEAAAPALSASFDHSKPQADAVDAVVAPKTWSSPTRLARWKARAAGAAVALSIFASATQARAWPDGNPNDFKPLAQTPTISAAPAHVAQAAQAAPTPVWVPIAVIAGVIAAIAGLVWLMRWHDKRHESASSDLSMYSAGPGYVGTIAPRGSKADAEDKKKYPGGRDAAGKPITFDSVAGQDEAVSELRKVLHFQKNRAQYQALNPRVKGEKGILLYGPPGTGKTMLVQALANEAGMHFVKMVGSDFLQELVGVGPKRVRELFAEARGKGGPTIIFIDEIEAILKKRTGSSNNSEEERTVNAILAELDGFDKDPDVLVIGATNLPDTIDPAALRGGRFALQIPVGLPDVEGRKKVFNHYLGDMKLAEGVDAETLAKQTPGVAGADIEYIVNRASLKAGFDGDKAVSMERFMDAIDERAAGLKRKIVLTPEEKRVLAYHEGGHALMSHLLPDADPVRKVTIVAAGLGALGYMQAMPENERTMYPREWLVARMAVAFGGRAGEELATGGKRYSGASNDIEQASRIARAMVMEYGMSDAVGTIAFDPLWGQQKAGTARSEWMNRKLDQEVKRLVDEALALARTTLANNREKLDALAAELQEKETLRGPDLQRLIPLGR